MISKTIIVESSTNYKIMEELTYEGSRFYRLEWVDGEGQLHRYKTFPSLDKAKEFLKERCK